MSNAEELGTKRAPIRTGESGESVGEDEVAGIFGPLPMTETMMAAPIEGPHLAVTRHGQGRVSCRACSTRSVASMASTSEVRNDLHEAGTWQSLDCLFTRHGPAWTGC